ncbi:MAG: APC family permease, partial [Thermoanaerobaculia bacterium]
WMFLASKVAAAGTVALGLAGYLAILIPGVPPRAIAIGAIVVFTILNYFGIQKTSRVNLVVVACSLAALAGFVALGATKVKPAHLHPLLPSGWQSVVQAAALLFFAYTGYARIATLGEEVHEPEKTIPRAIIITITVASLLYVLVAFVAVGTAGAPALAQTSAPLAVAAGTFGMPGAVVLIAVGAVAAMLGVILSQLLALSRMVFAMGRRGDFPRALSFVHPRSRVPSRAVVIVGAPASTVAALGQLRAIATAASFTILVYYGITNLAALRSPAARSRYTAFVPGVGLVSCTVLAFSLPKQTITLGVALLAVGLIVHMIAGRARSR